MLRLVRSELLRELLSPGATTYRRFLDDWFGPRGAGFGVAADELPLVTPTTLRGFYEYAGRWPGLFAFNYLYPPEELRPDATGRVVFCRENQGVCFWATSGAGHDPPVDITWSRPGASDAQSWHREGEPLSRFLLQLVLFEAVIGAPSRGSALAQPTEMLERILEPLSCLPLAPWLWPVAGSRFWAGADVVAFVSPEAGSSDAEVLIAARSPAPLEHLRRLPPETWEALILDRPGRGGEP
jgi:hypothetical protein